MPSSKKHVAYVEKWDKIVFWRTKARLRQLQGEVTLKKIQCNECTEVVPKNVPNFY